MAPPPAWWLRGAARPPQPGGTGRWPRRAAAGRLRDSPRLPRAGSHHGGRASTASSRVWRPRPPASSCCQGAAHHAARQRVSAVASWAARQISRYLGQAAGVCGTSPSALLPPASLLWSAASWAPSEHRARGCAAATSRRSGDGDDPVSPTSLCALDAVGSRDALPLSCGRSHVVAVPRCLS
jgi:hypothetical protein